MDRREFLGTALAVLGTEPASAIAQSQSSLRSDCGGGSLPRIRVHSEGHFLETEEGKPFFWLADTAWELIHRTTREETSYYLMTRSLQRFTVIQTVVLAEFDGITKPTPLGDLPFVHNDPATPNPAYFRRVVEIVDEAASRGLYIALLPTWGDKLTAPWGAGPRLFTNSNLSVARNYARYLADLVKDRSNVLWMLGGDRPPRVTNEQWLKDSATSAGFSSDQNWIPIWTAIAEGLAEGFGRRPLILYHPNGGSRSSTYLHQESWLSVNGMQSGHGGGHDVPVWDWVASDYILTPPKPTLDLEPNYEDHPYRSMAALGSVHRILSRFRCAQAGLPLRVRRRLRGHLWASRHLGLCGPQERRDQPRRPRLGRRNAAACRKADGFPAFPHGIAPLLRNESRTRN